MEPYKKRKNPNTYVFNFYTFNPHFYCGTMALHTDSTRSLINAVSPNLAERYADIFSSIKQGRATDAYDASTIQFVTNKPRYKLIRICDEAISILFEAYLSMREEKILRAYSWFCQLKHIVTYSKVVSYTCGFEESLSLSSPLDEIEDNETN